MTTWLTQLLNGWGDRIDVYLQTFVQQNNQLIASVAKVAEQNYAIHQHLVAQQDTDTDLLEKIHAQLSAVKEFQENEIDILGQILDLLTPPSSEPTGFRITQELITSKGEIMADARKFSGVDMQILPNGKVRYTLTVQPATATLAAGTAAIAAVSSAPLSLTVAADPADTTGLVFLGAPTVPEVPATAIVTTFSVTLLPAQGGATISQAADPVDVVADPSQPTGFAVVESAG
jgi:hypothetical protein